MSEDQAQDPQEGITLEEVAEFLWRLSKKEGARGARIRTRTWFATEREFHLMRWAKKALTIVSGYDPSANRTQVIMSAEERISAFVESAEKDMSFPIEISLDDKGMDLMHVAARAVDEFRIRRDIDGADERRNPYGKRSRK